MLFSSPLPILSRLASLAASAARARSESRASSLATKYASSHSRVVWLIFLPRFDVLRALPSFFVRTSNFRAEAERSYFLPIFLHHAHHIVFNADLTRKPQEARHMLVRLALTPRTIKMSRQPTLGKFGFTKGIERRGSTNVQNEDVLTVTCHIKM